MLPNVSDYNSASLSNRALKGDLESIPESHFQSSFQSHIQSHFQSRFIISRDFDFRMAKSFARVNWGSPKFLNDRKFERRKWGLNSTAELTGPTGRVGQTEFNGLTPGRILWSGCKTHLWAKMFCRLRWLRNLALRFCRVSCERGKLMENKPDNQHEWVRFTC